MLPRTECSSVETKNIYQVLECTYIRRDFSCMKKLISGKRESVSYLNSMQIDEQWEC